jgi:hypothetical protein
VAEKAWHRHIPVGRNFAPDVSNLCHCAKSARHMFIRGRNVVTPELHAAILLAVATGIVASGLIGSLWEISSADPLNLSILRKEDLLVPVRVAVLVFSAPWLLISLAMWWFIEKPPMGIPLLIAGLAWSFIEGVFLLTQVFGIA